MLGVNHKFNYFYKIVNTLTNEFYYGVHSTDNINDGYMGSGVVLKRAQEIYGIHNFKKEIIKYFETSEEAFLYEAEIVTDEVISNPMCYNVVHGGDGGWDILCGKTVVKDNQGNRFLVSVDDPRLKTGELVGIRKGFVTVKDAFGNTKSVSVNDPRYLSGELVHVMTNCIIVEDQSGKKVRKNIDDPCLQSGEYSKLVNVKDSSGRILNVSMNDPRYMSGELVPIWKGRHHSEDTIKKLKNKFDSINHQQGSRNSQFGTCWVHNEDKSIKIKKDELQSYIDNGWESGRKMSHSNWTKPVNCNKGCLGKIRISNPLTDETLFIKQDDLKRLSELINAGWKLGTSKSHSIKSMNRYKNLYQAIADYQND